MHNTYYRYLLIDIMHLLEKYNKILQNAQYINQDNTGSKSKNVQYLKMY